MYNSISGPSVDSGNRHNKHYKLRDTMRSVYNEDKCEGPRSVMRACGNQKNLRLPFLGLEGKKIS